MTLAELQEEVLENIGLHPNADRIQSGEVTRLLNLAMREISLETGVPTIYATVPNTGVATGPFKMPVNVHPEGVLYAEVIDDDGRRNREISLISVAEANVFHPSWEDDSDRPYHGIPFLLWSPADPDSGIRPIGIEEAQYRFLLHAVPEPMTKPEDEPFASLDCPPGDQEPRRQPGAMPAYHRILAHHVTHELLQRLGDDRWQAFYARYEKMKKDMFSQIQPSQVYLPTMRTGHRVKRYA